MRRIERDVLDASARGTTRSRRSATEMQDDDGGGGRHLPHRPGLAKGVDAAPRAAGAGARGSGSATPAGPSTPSCWPPSRRPTCSTSPSASWRPGLQPRGVARRPPAHDFPDRDDERVPASTTWCTATTTVPRRVEQLPVTITRWPPGRAGLRKVSAWRQTSIRSEVTRYRPDKDTEPAWQDYDVPLREEWTVLDGLNHVKDEVDTTLTFRWSCRMGICGSCGMNVDGEPRLTCATFLSDYAPGPVRGRAARQLPGRARPRRRHHRLHGEAAAG